MHPLVIIEETAAEPPSFTKEEHAHIKRFKTPFEKQLYNCPDPRYFPRKPVENVGRWYGDHKAKLRSLERAEGIRYSGEW